MMNSFEIMGREFGIPLNKDKTLGLTTCLIFLGLEIDIKTIKPQSCLVLTYWMNKEKIVFKDLESLVGKPFFLGRLYLEVEHSYVVLPMSC